ncbi:unnamed protein product, partial [Cyprideis torosa]
MAEGLHVVLFVALSLFVLSNGFPQGLPEGSLFQGQAPPTECAVDEDCSQVEFCYEGTCQFIQQGPGRQPVKRQAGPQGPQDQDKNKKPQFDENTRPKRQAGPQDQDKNKKPQFDENTRPKRQADQDKNKKPQFDENT